jgi:hypothetical protein
MANDSIAAYSGDRSIIERELEKLLKQPDRRANIERIKKLLAGSEPPNRPHTSRKK